jgi:hypothetical protein
MRHELNEAWTSARALPFDAVVILLSIPLIITTFWYFGRSDFYEANLAALVPADWPLARLYPFFYFALSAFVLRTLVPLVLARFVLKRPLRDFGFAPPSRFEWAWVYVVLFAAVLPFIWYASTLGSFQERYPFCGNAILVDGKIPVLDFLVYQMFYGLVFVSGESYWRGFVTFGLQRHIGDLAILVMVTPYCMTHYGKPAPEVYASILTGVVLGFLALRHRSFWLGVAVHWAAAISMDVLAIGKRGLQFVL